MSPLDAAALLGSAIVLGVVVPWAALRMFVPSLAESPAAAATNFRGTKVFYGLGVVWLIWAGSAIIGGGIVGAIAGTSKLVLLMLAGPLALVAFALGLIDDSYGTSAARGFRGHISSLLKGRLTTGGMKLFGIGLASLVVALIVGQIAPWRSSAPDALFVLKALVAGAAIALTSNFVNLTDLRPGRALKVYSALSILGVLAVTATGLFASVVAATAGTLALQPLVDMAALTVFLLGPVIATYRYDLREEGMLGDAGANPMGAVAGMFIVAGLPFAGVLAYFALILALNLLSERVSYSRLIEANSLLRWLDGLGRMP